MQNARTPRVSACIPGRQCRAPCIVAFTCGQMDGIRRPWRSAVSGPPSPGQMPATRSQSAGSARRSPARR
eukprot:scaffold23500_cov117-Isochrysis_galbana.AAC.3